MRYYDLAEEIADRINEIIELRITEKVIDQAIMEKIEYLKAEVAQLMAWKEKLELENSKLRAHNEALRSLTIQETTSMTEEEKRNIRVKENTSLIQSILESIK